MGTLADPRTRIALAWIALGAAFAPVLVDTVRHALDHSWATYSLLFPLLIAASASRARPARRHGGLAGLLIGAAALLQIWAVASGEVRMARPALPLAAAGLLVAQGRLDATTGLLLPLAIPLPRMLLDALARPLLPALVEGLAWISRWSGTPALADGTRLERAPGPLVLESVDLGATTGALAFGVAWLASRWRGRGIAAALGRALACAAGAALLHGLATAATVWVLEGGGGGLDPVRPARDAVAGLLALALTALVLRRDRPERPGPRPGISSPAASAASAHGAADR